MMSGHEEQASDAFGSGEPFTIGVEEELFLVDPVTGRQTNASDAVQKRLGPLNGLRGHLPLLQALAANSPYRHGRDTGLASAREVTVRGWPRSGVPRAMHDYRDFLETARLLARAADVPDYTWFWWKLRPHPRLGTVEIRALDAQASLDDTAGLVALIHCLARHVAEADPEPDPPAEVLEEGAFRAARFGVRARLPDAEGRLRGSRSCSRMRLRAPELTPQSSNARASSTGSPRC